MFITGAEGPNAHKVIGKYMATGDVQNDRSLFHNSGNDTWLHYALNNQWWVSVGAETKDAMKPAGFAYCVEPNLFDPTHGKTWMDRGSKQVEQGSLVVSHDLSQVCAALPPCVPVSDHA